MEKKISSLSILFPVYKDSKTIEILINKSVSLCNELSLDYEIIIVDDFCPESSGEIAKKYMKSNTRIKIKVMASQLNRGLKFAPKIGYFKQMEIINMILMTLKKCVK